MHAFSDLKVCTIDINLKSSAVEKIPNSQKFLATVFILCFHRYINWTISRPFKYYKYYFDYFKTN